MVSPKPWSTWDHKAGSCEHYQPHRFTKKQQQQNNIIYNLFNDPMAKEKPRAQSCVTIVWGTGKVKPLNISAQHTHSDHLSSTHSLPRWRKKLTGHLVAIIP